MFYNQSFTNFKQWQKYCSKRLDWSLQQRVLSRIYTGFPFITNTRICIGNTKIGYKVIRKFQKIYFSFDYFPTGLSNLFIKSCIIEE